jgi:hypothetical protein
VSDMAKRDDRPLAAGSAAAKPNPLKQLPEPWREPVLFFFAVYSDTLKGTTGLVARFRLWMRDDGLTLPEARAVMKRLMRPEHAAAIQFPGQLMAALAEGVAETVRQRREREERERDRRRRAAEAERFPGHQEPIGGTHVPTL